MSHFGYIGHHLIVAIIDHIPHGWVMLMTHVFQLRSPFSAGDFPAIDLHPSHA